MTTTLHLYKNIRLRLLCLMLSASPAFVVGTAHATEPAPANLGSDLREPARIPAQSAADGLPALPSSPAALPYAAYKVFAANNLGMHCVDADFSVFSILPPFNVVNAQVIGQDARGRPHLLGPDQVILSYSPKRDRTGSINSTSVNKTNFWNYAQALFGLPAPLPVGQGLTGLSMPGDALSPTETQFSYDAANSWFSAAGIPIIPIDDAGKHNFYPLMRIQAAAKTTSTQVGSLDVVLPVSDETTCRTCHTTGGPAAKDPQVVWAKDPNIEIQSRKNVLLLHDFRSNTGLMRSANAGNAVLCAGCHYSPALDLAGSGPSPEQKKHALMSAVMHAFHGDKMKDGAGKPFADHPNLPGQPPVKAAEQACYQCHPGLQTRCLRGAMSTTLDCQNCHGNMQAVGGVYPLKAGGSIDGTNDGHSRRPWTDVPRCQSCHTGDAVSHLAPKKPYQLAPDKLRFLFAYDPADKSASPLLAVNPRFAENPKHMFRFSKGHGGSAPTDGVACQGCHGSTHAIWPEGAKNPNDNVAARELQGHSGVIGECTACHKAGSLSLTMDGPHGLHNVNDPRWVSNHGDFWQQSPSECRSCHGKDLNGTVLARTFAARSFKTEEFGPVNFSKGEEVTCFSCHASIPN